MFQNMKTDIIYYKTNTDFEMEFNLCGCCRMRLLTDKTPDRKTMVHSLARAVSRSQIILVVGSLFGNSGSISSVSDAIGSKLVPLDNKTYGIKATDEIYILETATPLVTPDGIFGGCIIESGPQTMILLSENKAIRKTIMQNLIHPYIEELYANLLKEKVNSSGDNNQGDPSFDESASDEIICEADENYNPVIEGSDFITDYNPSDSEKEYETTDELITESDEVEEEEEIENSGDDSFVTEITENDAPEIEPSETEELLTEISEVEPIEEEDTLGEKIVFSVDNIEEDEEEEIIPDDIPFITEDENYDPDNTIDDLENYEQNQEFVSEGEEENLPFKKYSLNLPILILTVVLLLTIAILCYCIFFIPSSNGETGAAFIKETFDILFA